MKLYWNPVLIAQIRNTVMDKFGRKKCDIRNGPKAKARGESALMQQTSMWSAGPASKGSLAELVNMAEGRQSG